MGHPKLRGLGVAKCNVANFNVFFVESCNAGCCIAQHGRCKFQRDPPKTLQISTLIHIYIQTNPNQHQIHAQARWQSVGRWCWKNGGRQEIQDQSRMRRMLTPEQREVAKLSYEEIGRSLAALVLEHDYSEDRAWALVSDLGLYQRWELQGWLILYRKLERSRIRRLERREKRHQEKLARIEQAKPRKLLKALRKQDIG